MGVENGMFRSEIGSGFGDPGDKPPPKILRSTFPGSQQLLSTMHTTVYHYDSLTMIG